LDDDPRRVDRDVLCSFLTEQAYWGRWRQRRTILGQLDSAWRVVGAYLGADGPMVGFARAVSDGAAVAYLADVFVLPEHRGRGLGHALVSALVDVGPGRDFRWMLHTADAHGLYTGHGFQPPDGTFLERPRPPEPGDSAPAVAEALPSQDWLADTRDSYDTVAPSYADQLRAALDKRPFEQSVLALFTARVKLVGGPVADLGCGPGRLTAHLNRLGLEAFGVDLSPRMIEIAQRDHPGLRFEVGSMTDLDVPDAGVGGVLAWFSLIHVPDPQVPVVLAHVRRVLRPGGVALLAFHRGQGRTLKTEGYGGHPMHVHVYRRRLDQVAASLQDVGLTVDTRIAHDPEPGVSGGFVFASRPERTPHP
jgi:SAM-dependent methyltransferase/GNAT superfamily N-acetyltransferase